MLACNTYNVALIVANILQPNMLNTDEWNWGPKSGLFWAGTCAVSMVWTYFRLPELANRCVSFLLCSRFRSLKKGRVGTFTSNCDSS